jgi:hypothetical protein
MQLVPSLALLAVSVVTFRFAMPVGGVVRPVVRLAHHGAPPKDAD